LWDGQKCDDWAEQFSENIRIVKTPGHDSTSLTFFIKTESGIVAICGDVFWKEDFPEEDAYAQDMHELRKSRKLVLENADWVIPGHGKMFKAKK